MKSTGTCLYIFMGFLRFLDFSQKLLGSVLKPPGDMHSAQIFWVLP